MSDHHNETPENCTHDCSTCGENCEHAAESLQQALRPGARVDKVIAVVSGKGGVGKSLVTSLLACEMQRRGHQAAVLDADITGPSIPQAFGVHGSAMGGEDFLYANRTRTGIEIMSINLLLPNETDPVVWRGPVIAGAVTQFWTDVQWENVNYMFVDMPPGTGDVPLTVFQSLPVAGVVVVTSPQELVGMIVDKAVNMADMMHVPVLGIVENMAYYTCPDCGKQHAIFGESHIEAIAAKHGIPNTAKLPIDPQPATHRPFKYGDGTRHPGFLWEKYTRDGRINDDEYPCSFMLGWTASAYLVALETVRGAERQTRFTTVAKD